MQLLAFSLDLSHTCDESQTYRVSVDIIPKGQTSSSRSMLEERSGGCNRDLLISCISEDILSCNECYALHCFFINHGLAELLLNECIEEYV